MASMYDGRPCSSCLLAYIMYMIHHICAANEMDIKDEEGNLIVYNTPIFNETWARMEKLYESGKAKAIGVSNFSVKK